MMSKFDELRKAVYADRFGGRMKAIKKAFEAYEEEIGLSRWKWVKQWIRRLLLGKE